MREPVRSAALWAGALAAAMSAGIVAEVTPAVPGSARSVSAAVVAPQSHSPALSGNGRFLAFVTDAPLVTADTNGVADVYVRNLGSGRTIRASTGRNGGPANRASSEPAMSADGRYVVFTSAATNLVPGDTNGVADVFRRDLQTNRTIQVSLRDDEGLGGAASGSAAVSADGNLVAFDSFARLATTDTDHVSDVYVRAIGAGTTTEISRRSTSSTGRATSTTAACGRGCDHPRRTLGAWSDFLSPGSSSEHWHVSSSRASRTSASSRRSASDWWGRSSAAPSRG